MAYDIKDVFYLSTGLTIATGNTGATTSQLDLSAYIDPITTRSRKGTGLAIYKTYYSIVNSEDTNEVAPKVTDEGVMSFSLQAGAGLGDVATGGLNTSAPTIYQSSNALLVSAGNFYGMASGATSTPVPMDYIMPSEKVPYVIVRDNVCLVYNVSTSQQFESNSKIAVRLECAQITLDQATLNQLLRTQTV